MSHYHASTPMSPEALSNYRRQAAHQQELVEGLYRRNPAARLTATQVYTILVGDGSLHPMTPLTSVRRAVTNLAKLGILVKLTDTRRGIYGRPECYYQLGPLNP